ncbi:hypothetical protein [Desulfitobacterium dichloroeliminans]|uniref:hypothetical protein n=1 Tax=Desulfitobacterium dichloroeliminans TaxID=233055 RepID=UPI0012EA1F37|nr:hypothetical protein [Desulfitobacterium dichloroeliminans]
MLDNNSQYVSVMQTLFFIGLIGREIIKGHICKRKDEIGKQQVKQQVKQQAKKRK